MKRISFLIILPLLLLFFISSPLFAITRGIRITTESGENLFLYKDYHALVVGVSDYQKWPKLPNAANDAKEVASKLEGLGFGVKILLDPTSREMKTALNEMVYNMGKEKDRALLFYYAGHGETETLADKTKMGYIIPKDCPLLKKDPLGFVDRAISMRDIESASLRIRSKHVMMLFDSCFSGSLFSLVRAAPDDITEKSVHPVRQYITAGREDEQVPDRSIFKRCLLIGLEGDADLTGDGYITGSELGMYLSDNVVNYTKRGQHPQYGKINNPDLDRGDFIFVPAQPPQVRLSSTKSGSKKGSTSSQSSKTINREKSVGDRKIAALPDLSSKQGKKQPEELKETIRLIIEQTYKDRNGPVEGNILPFESIAQKLLGHSDLIVVGPETEESDYTLKIKADGEALGRFYSLMGMGKGTYHYTGAAVSGTATLERMNVPVDEIFFSGEICPPSQIKLPDSRTNPYYAPFEEALGASGFVSDLVHMLGEEFGTEFLLNALKDENRDIREHAQWALGGMGVSALEPLIAALKYEDPKMREGAAIVLERITHQSFGEDYDAWSKWQQEEKK